MGDSFPFEGKRLCDVCGKRIATRLCDMPIGRMSFCGHLPRHLAVMLPSRIVWEVPMHQTVTCDRALCDRCAVSLGPDIDLCPACVQRVKEAGGQN